MDPDLPAMLKVQAGDHSGLEELMAQHQQAIFRLAYRFTGNTTDAADLAEEAFIKVYFKASQYRPSARVKSWIFTLAANLCRDFLRRNQKQRANVPLFAPTDAANGSIEQRLPDDSLTPANSAESAEQLHQIHSAIRALPYRLQFPFSFCILEGHSYKACAEVLKVSAKTVETRIYRARQLLRAAILRAETAE